MRIFWETVLWNKTYMNIPLSRTAVNKAFTKGEPIWEIWMRAFRHFRRQPNALEALTSSSAGGQEDWRDSKTTVSGGKKS